MAEVFLSYSREDKARAEQVARGLAAAGVQVFWDNEIPPGQTWADYIETKLTQCKALIVLWSANSAKSQWVREEARLGRDKGVLIPAMLDGTPAPFGFGEVQAANLSTWNGQADHPDWRRFLEAVTAAASSSAPRRAPTPMASAPPRAQAFAATAEGSKKGVAPWVWIAGGAVGVIALLAVIGAMLPNRSQQNGPVAPPADQSPSTPPVDAAPPSTPPALSNQDYQNQVMQKLAAVEQSLGSQGFQRVADPFNGQLPQGQTQDWPVTLNLGFEYWAAGVCDNDCSDLDLMFLDGYGNVISQDNNVNAQPVVSVIPTTAGQFSVRANMYNCSVSPCFYTIALYARAQ